MAVNAGENAHTNDSFAGLRLIEDALIDHPAVAAAAVLVERCGDLSDDGELLVAYVATLPEAPAPATAALREHVAGMVPPFAVPDVIVLVDRIPVRGAGEVGAGEVDTNALPQAPTAVPESLIGALLCEQFAAVLGLNRVGADENFFDLGGHSLLVTRLMNRIEPLVGGRIRVRDIFAAKTVLGICARIDNDEPPLAPRLRGWSDPIPAPAAYPGPTGGHNSTARAVRLSGPLALDALRSALTAVHDRHEALRTLISDVAGDQSGPYQRILAQARVELTVTVAAPGELRLALASAAARPIDRSVDLPLRTTVFEVGADEHVLLLTVHSSGGDERSAEIVAHDLAWAYNAALRGAAPVWETLGAQAADHALWSHALLGAATDPGSRLAAHLRHWREALAGIPVELTVHGAKPRPPAPTGRTATQALTLTAAATARLVELARAQRATPAMVVQAGVAVALRTLGAGTDLPLGIPVHRRGQPALRGSVGPYGSFVVHRIDLSDDPAFADLVARVRDIALRADAHSAVPFAAVAAALDPTAAPARHPLCHITVHVDEHGWETPRFTGLVSRVEPVDVDACALDLAAEFNFSPGPGGDRLRGSLRYRRDRFDPPTAERIAQRISEVLTAAAAGPDTALSELDLSRGTEFVELNAGPDAPLFVFPPITGVGWGYAALLPYLDPDVPVYAVRTDTLACSTLTTLSELAAEYAARLRAQHPEGPYRLVGWSVGGIIAHAVATELQRLGVEVTLLALLDAYPVAAQKQHFGADRDPQQRTLAALLGSVGRRTSATERLTRADTFDAVRAALDLSAAEADDMIDTALTHVLLADDHRPGTFTGRILFFAATEGTPPGLTARAWAGHVDGQIDVVAVPTTHYDLLADAGAAMIGTALAAELTAIR